MKPDAWIESTLRDELRHRAPDLDREHLLARAALYDRDAARLDELDDPEAARGCREIARRIREFLG